MTRRAEIELLARVLLAAALVGVAWAWSPWPRLAPGTLVGALALAVIAPAVAAASQPALRLILAAGLGAAVPALAFGRSMWLAGLALLPAALMGVPVGMLMRRFLDRIRRAEPQLPRSLAAATAVVITYPIAYLVAAAIYVGAAHAGARILEIITPLAGYAAAIGGAAWAWPWRRSGEADDA
jgi:hypothetical protein